MTARTAAEKAKISATRKRNARAARAAAVDGVTLADLHAQGFYMADAARRMGWSVSKVKNWEADTGLKFRRVTGAEKGRRLSAAIGPEERARRSAVMLTAEAKARSRAVMQQVWSDPERRQDMIEKRVASWLANPDARKNSVIALRKSEAKRIEGVRAFFADAVRSAPVKAKVSERLRERWSDPAKRAQASAKTREQRRRQRVEKGLAALEAGTLTKQQARALIREMTGEERMIWMMQQDAKAANQRMKAA